MHLDHTKAWIFQTLQILNLSCLSKTLPVYKYNSLLSFVNIRCITLLYNYVYIQIFRTVEYHVCVCAVVYVCMYVHMRACIYVYMFVGFCIMCVYVCIHACIPS